MQTNFTPAQLSDPRTAASEKILRTCVHCGFCTATCPTYVLMGDELDSPRGRIYLIKDMLENGRKASEEVVTHIDRCLSCLSCMTTCPSGVHYMHLVDHARAHIEETYSRSFSDRLIRSLLAMILPYPMRFRLALAAAPLGKIMARALSFVAPVSKPKTSAPLRPAREPSVFARLNAMFALAPSRLPGRLAYESQTLFPAEGMRRKRVALLRGCAQSVLDPGINDATIRLLNRLGVEVVMPKEEGCCGALVHHMGRDADSHAQAANNILAWTREIEGEGLDAIIITASGCGTTIKDYGFMFRDDAALAAKAARVSELAKDIVEFLTELDLKPARETGLTIAYHSACSMQHGQKITEAPKTLLRALGFRVKEAPEGHICCGSAGVYNILQPEIAASLRDRKAGNIARLKPDAIATGNIGCITQIAAGLAERGAPIPILHTVELADWAMGGPLPEKLAAAGLSGRPSAPLLAAE
ncbi:heterodisulfide reductase-related iron-sulfur binding cluster [Terrarubrum flagellatum]|uniref:heterodisulfide reductase-related iron-sulfur binding cluster n=1 Tax=Terrirubrum flagellatum TaxID=2895980 RepID=UPI0031452F82